jgi:hypothetical protein
MDKNLTTLRVWARDQYIPTPQEESHFLSSARDERAGLLVVSGEVVVWVVEQGIIAPRERLQLSG